MFTIKPKIKSLLNNGKKVIYSNSFKPCISANLIQFASMINLSLIYYKIQKLVINDLNFDIKDYLNFIYKISDTSNKISDKLKIIYCLLNKKCLMILISDFSEWHYIL